MTEIRQTLVCFGHMLKYGSFILCPMRVCLHTYYEYKESVSVHKAGRSLVQVVMLSLRMR